jgi:hypothetical protein
VKLTNGWRHLERVADGPGARTLIPVLGSGFVTQAVMAARHSAPDGLAVVRAKPGDSFPAPVDWLSLLRGVAKEFDCARAISHIEVDVPGQTTLLWDAMAVELTARSSGIQQAHAYESKMRRSVARRLRDDTLTYDLAQPFVESFLRLGWDDIVSFNFDSVLLPASHTHGASRGHVRPKPLSTGAARRASIAARKDGTTVWYPHGHHSDPDSIVLGAHAYGGRVAAMQAAFDAHARKRAPRKSSGLDSWVATMLERPLFFVGLSLTREEWTIWWLLSQRARFLARRSTTKRPAAFVFARRPAPADKLEAHAAFQTLARACELLGIELLDFADYRSGWKKLRSAIGWPE